MSSDRTYDEEMNMREGYSGVVTEKIVKEYMEPMKEAEKILYKENVLDTQIDIVYNDELVAATIYGNSSVHFAIARKLSDLFNKQAAKQQRRRKRR